jgi:hypothetical protein
MFFNSGTHGNSNTPERKLTELSSLNSSLALVCGHIAKCYE